MTTARLFRVVRRPSSPPEPTTADLARQIEAVRAMVAELLARAPRPAAPRLTVDERELLRAIVKSIGRSACFVAPDLLLRGKHEDPALGQVLRKQSIKTPRQLGWRMKRLVGRGVDRVSKTGTGLVWAVTLDVESF